MSYASSHARSESEVELASLHLHLPFTPPRQRSVMISIEDLEFPPLSLGKSVVEEEEEQHLGAALRALSLLNQSPTPSPPRTGANSPASSAAFSPCPLSPLPDAPFDNYFHLSRPLYSEGRFLSFGSSRSASSSSSTPRSGYSSSSSFGSSSAASSCGPATPEASTPDMSARAPPSIASRRKKAPKDSFALDLSSVSAALALAAPGRTTHGFADGRGDVVGAGAEGICRSRSSQGNGLLKNNFGGISVSTAVVDALEGPLTPHLRPRRSHGFAF